MGRVKRATNPYKPGESILWTTNTYDAFSRPISVTTPDGATVTTSYAGNTVTVTDPGGKKRRSITNALGQLVRVDEPNEAGNLGTISAPAQPTVYTFDTLDNLVQVNQGIQVRSFNYDSLGRLRQANNPETGTINYNYDFNGNKIKKTDAKGVETNYIYDTLNRITTRTHSDGTPTVTYTYENPNIPYSKGKLTKVSSSSTSTGLMETNYTQFNQLGELLASQQITNGQTYYFAYQYNLSGMLIEETYPSGRKVKNTFDADGDLATVQTQKSGGVWETRADNFTYSSAGGVLSMRLGNNLWENTQFNSRLQPTQIGLGSSQNTQDLLKLNYDYGADDNNGNIKSQTITVPNGFVATQTYQYDSVGRLKSAEEVSNNQPTWKQTFLYDQYGNRKFDPNQTTTLGNTIQDASGKTYLYDALKKQTQAKDAIGIVIGKYFYDGEGKRVRKQGISEDTIFVYDGFGSLTAEYTVSINQSAVNPNTTYLTQDVLGSPRVITNQAGNVQSRRDFMPFGEEIVGLGNRTQVLGYQPDNLRQKFTGYERDNETELDFAQNRYYSNKIGRFTSADVLMASAKSWSPQTWNRYSYVGNNPVNLVDPLGLEYWEGDLDGGRVVIWVAPGEKFPLGFANYFLLTDYIYALNGGFQVFNPTGAQGAQWFATAGDAAKQFLQWGGTAAVAEALLIGTGIAAAEAAAIVAVAAGVVYIAVEHPEATHDAMCGRGGYNRPCAPTFEEMQRLEATNKAAEEEFKNLVPPVDNGPLVGNANPNDDDPDKPKIPQANDKKLQNYMNDLYKGANSKNPVGSGSMADAIRNEIRTGQPTGKKFHSGPGEQYVTGLRNWLANNPNASASDRAIAQRTLDDLVNALAGN